MLDYWSSPPFDPTVKVYVFNYSNIAEVLSGAEKKIKVKEIGPYVFTERTIRTSLIFDGDKITFHVGLNQHRLVCTLALQTSNSSVYPLV
jgi:CD36 family